MRGVTTIFAVVPFLGLSTMAYAGATAPADPAQALAETFAHEGEAKPAPTVLPKTAKAAKDSKASAAPAAIAKTAEIEPAPVPPTSRPSLDYEIDMLRRARAEAAELKLPASAQPALVKPVAQKTPDDAIGVASPAAAGIAPAAPVSPTQAVTPPSVTPPTPAASPVKVEAKAVAPAATAAPVIAPDNAPHATLLVVLDPPKAAKPSTPPDPILCFGDNCFMSLGFESGAMAIKKADALKLKTTEEAKAGMCMSKSACVYRDVPIAQGAQAEIIDLANRDAATSGANDIVIDGTCAVEDGELGCDKPISSIDHRIWVVPEAVARTAGANVLDQAIADGLLEQDQAAATDK